MSGLKVWNNVPLLLGSRPYHQGTKNEYFQSFAPDTTVQLDVRVNNYLSNTAHYISPTLVISDTDSKNQLLLLLFSGFADILRKVSLSTLLEESKKTQ